MNTELAMVAPKAIKYYTSIFYDSQYLIPMLYAYIFLIWQRPNQSDNDYPIKITKYPQIQRNIVGNEKAPPRKIICDGVFQLSCGLVFRKCTEKKTR